MAEILRVIQPVSNQKFIRRIKTHELRIVLQTVGNSFVKQRTNLQRSWLPLLQYSDETIQSASRIDDVLNQQNILPFQPCFGVVNEVDGSTRYSSITVARCYQEIDLKWTSDLPHEVTEKDEASFEQSQHQKIAVRIGGGDLSAELSDSPRDSGLVERDSLDGSSRQAGI